MGMQIWVLLCYARNRYLFLCLEIVVIQVGYRVIQVYHFGVTVHWYSGRQLITSTYPVAPETGESIRSAS